MSHISERRKNTHAIHYQYLTIQPTLIFLTPKLVVVNIQSAHRFESDNKISIGFEKQSVAMVLSFFAANVLYQNRHSALIETLLVTSMSHYTRLKTAHLDTSSCSHYPWNPGKPWWNTGLRFTLESHGYCLLLNDVDQRPVFQLWRDRIMWLGQPPKKDLTVVSHQHGKLWQLRKNQ